MTDKTTVFDCIIIGAGVAGCCLARELSRYDLNCAVVEAGNDIAFATSRANSGIVHAGFDPVPGSLKAHYCVQGARLFPKWQAELEFGYLQNGSLVLAFAKDELSALRVLQERAIANDVSVELLDAERLRELEPAVSQHAIGALHAPHSGICDPYGLTFAAAENAAENGVSFFFEEQVVALKKDASGFSVRTASHRTFSCRTVINAAGVFADELNNMLSSQKLSITPVRGEYLLYDTPFGTTFTRTMFQAPGVLGKGVVVTPTIHGNLLVGPNALPQTSKTDVATSATGLETLLLRAQKTWPEASKNGVIANFAGLRAKGERGDFIIGEAPDVPGFFNIACFESPGLTAAPAVAVDMAEHISRVRGAGLKGDFNPRRKRSGRKLFALMTEEERSSAIAEDPDQGQIVCRCCTVSRGDLAYEFKGSLPVLSLDTLKWRTGITMGRCHGGFCAPELMQIVHEYTGLLPEQMDKRLPGSPFVVASSKEYAERCSSGDETSPSQAHTFRNEYGSRDFLVYDVVVIGAGAAGMAAAVAAKQEGAGQVALFDRERFLGGILRQCIHNGFGLTRFKRELTGPEYASREAANLTDCGIDLFLGTAVLSFEPGEPEREEGHLCSILATNKQGLLHVKAKSVVLATGSRERGQGALNLAGTRPAGVFSAGSAQALINLEGCLPGRKVLIQGSGDIGLIMARRCLYSGAEVLGVFARSSKPSGLRRNVQQCLDDYGIPFYGNRVATRLEGDARLEAVWVSQVDPGTKQVIEGSEERWPCDTLLLSIGLEPETELALEAGIEVDSASGSLRVNTWLETSVPGIFVCGNALHIHDLADHASEEGERAGRRAAQFAQGEAFAASASSTRGMGCSSDQPSPGQSPSDQPSVASDDGRVSSDQGDVAKNPEQNKGPLESSKVMHCLVKNEPESVTAHKSAREESVQKKPSSSEKSNRDANDTTGLSAAVSGEADYDEYTCVRCPKGCTLSVFLASDGALEKVTGEGCKLGLEYAAEEVVAPKRIVTASLSAARSLEPLSVKTTAPVPRDKVFAVLAEAHELTLEAPVTEGTLLIENVAQTGVGLIATKTI